MVYLLYGNNDYLINKEVEKLKQNTDEMSINNYDLEETLLNQIIEDASMPDLFSNEKCIIVYNSYIFSGTTNKKLKEQDTTILENYINSDQSTNIIFILNKEKIDERKKITKLIKEKGKVLEFNKTTDINSIIKNLFEDYKISNDLINLLIDRVGNDIYTLENEIQKIKLYKDNDKIITKEDILSLTNKNINTDIFNLIEHIINKDIDNAYYEYKEIIKLEEPIKIMIMLSNQFRIIYQAKELFKKGYTEGEIASIINIHPYRIKLALNKSRNYDTKSILKLLYQLSNMDIEIKTGKIEPSIALELFILNLKNVC